MRRTTRATTHHASQAVLDFRLKSLGEKWRHVYKVLSTSSPHHHHRFWAAPGAPARSRRGRGAEGRSTCVSCTVPQALLVLEFLALRGAERCTALAEQRLLLLRCLGNFAYTSPDGRDHGANVRIR